MSPSSTTKVAVDDERIMRYERFTYTGHIHPFDELALTGGISAAAADPTGDYLVTHYEVHLHVVGHRMSENGTHERDANLIELISISRCLEALVLLNAAGTKRYKTRFL